VLEAGWTLRHLNDSNALGVGPKNITGLKGTGYAQESSSFFNNRVHLLGGIRYDGLTDFPPHPLSPQASVSVEVARATQVQFGYGHYVQY
jgi:hypothetical protein